MTGHRTRPRARAWVFSFQPNEAVDRLRAKGGAHRSCRPRETVIATCQSSGTTPRPTGLAVGVITVAAVVLILAGVLNAMQGVVALATNVGDPHPRVRRVRHLGVDGHGRDVENV